MKYAVVYARYSSERQTEQSIEGQLRICNKYAEDNGLKIIDTYIDRAMTGTNDNRAAFQKMLSDCEKSAPWEVVIVYAIDRFGRNSIEIAVNKQKLKKNRKRLVSATQRTSENIDGTKNLDGILLENMYIGLAEYYSAELSQKVKRGQYENRLKGFYSGGPIPFGYISKEVDPISKKKKIYVDENRAKVVREIFNQYASGVVVQDIIDDLSSRGIFYKGKPFVQNTVYKMLRLEKYIGIRRNEEGVSDNIFPPIVPFAIYEKVGAILTKNKIGSKSREVDFLLKGKCLCGYCGYNISGESGTSKSGKKMFYYKCMGRKKHHVCNKSILPKKKLEDVVLKTTTKVLGTVENIEVIAEAVMKVHEKRKIDESLINILTAQRDSINKSLSNIVKAIEQGLFNATTQARMEELEQQLSDIEQKISMKQYRAQNQLSREKIIEYLTKHIQKKPILMIFSLIQKIVIFDDKIEIYYNYTENNNPDDKNHRDYYLKGCSDSSPMVEMGGVEPPF